MCTYRISVDDDVLERVRPALPNDEAVETWMQSQMDILLMQLAESLSYKPKVQDDKASYARRIAHIHKILSQIPELTSNKESSYSPELEAILAMPLLDRSDVGLNGEQARMDYYKEKYAL